MTLFLWGSILKLLKVGEEMDNNSGEKLEKLYDDSLNDMRKIVGDNYDYTEIAAYIMEKSNNRMGTEVALDYARFLVLHKNYIKDEIIQEHKADADIARIISEYNAEIESFESLGDKVEIPLAPDRRKMTKDWYKKGIIAVVLVAELISLGAVVHKRSDYEKNQITQHIGMIISNGESKDDIITQNKETVYVMQNGERVKQYDYLEEGIANDIIKIIIAHPEALDEVLHNTYCSMTEGRLYNMDNVMKTLYYKMTQDPALQDLAQTFYGCPSFLNYMQKSGRVRDAYSEEIIEAIKLYNKTDHFNDPTSFEKLDEHTKEVLNAFAASYRESKGLNYKEAATGLQQMAVESKGL